MNDNLNDCSISKISIADYIISDYINYGVYQNFNSTLILYGNGNTSWHNNVESIHPLISNCYPIYVYTIQSELNNTFELRKISLLKTLNNLINKSFVSTNNGSFSLYDTSKFNTIWEYLLQRVFKDEYYNETFKNKYNINIFKSI